MVLHAIVHLFYVGEMDDALRDLVDVADLLDAFWSHRAWVLGGFWGRVEALDVARPAWYALRYVQRLLAARCRLRSWPRQVHRATGGDSWGHGSAVPRHCSPRIRNSRPAAPSGRGWACTCGRTR